MTFNFNVGGITPQDVNTGGGGETPTGGIFPKNIAGLVMCLDGEINSRSGVHDESVNGMQNLMYTPVFGHDSKGYKEVLNGTPTFDSKGCTLGGTCFYPDYNDNEMTVEFCLEMTHNMEGFPAFQFFPVHRVYYGGWQIWIGDPDMMEDQSHKGLVTFQAFNASSTQTKHMVPKVLQTYGEKIYYAVTTKLNEANSTKVYMNGELTTEFNYNEDGVASAGDNSYPVNIGLGGLCSTSTSSTTSTSSDPYRSGAFYSPYLKWYTFRKWSRRLTPDEIKQNYLQDKKRFG